LPVARAAGAALTDHPHPLHGPDGKVIATDVALLGRPDAAKLMVLISGTHGVSGAYGSASQTAWLERRENWTLPDDTAVLMVHLINPWGVAWSRRTNEDNVDLNRNFIDWTRPAPQNTAYAKVHPALVCAEWTGAARVAADETLAEITESWGQSALTAIIQAGQYTHPGRTWAAGVSSDRVRSAHRGWAVRLSGPVDGDARGSCGPALGATDLWPGTGGGDHR